MAGYITRIFISGLCAGLILLFVLAVRSNIPWLIPECQRSEPWKLPIFWLSEATAFLLFAEYTVFALMRGFSRPWHPRKFTFRAFIIGTCLNLGIATWSLADEHLGHARAVSAHAELVAGKSRQQDAGFRRYSFTCTFRDQHGTARIAWFSDVQTGLPPSIRDDIDGNRLPSKLNILYDPRWPARNWIADVPYSDNNRLSIYSLLAILFSGLLTSAIALLSRWVPWLPPAGIAPFLAMTGLLCAAGFLQGW